MKAMHLLIASTGVLAFGAMAMATPILSQNFDASPFTDGTTITTTGLGDNTTVGGGWVYSSDTTSPVVTTEQSHSSSQSLKVFNNNNSLYGQNTNAGFTSGILETSFYAYWISGSSSVQFRLGTNIDTSTNPGVSLGAGGNIEIYANGGSFASATTLGTTGWYGVKLLTDFDNSTFDVYLDSSNGFARIEHNLATGVLADDADNAVSFKARNGSEGEKYFYLDDVNSAPVPEPATGALLVLGGSALLLKRRRRA